MKPRIKHSPAGLAVVITVAGLLVISAAFARAGQEPTAISSERLRAMMENPEVVILDVRQARYWKNSRNKIKGAVRQEPRQFDAWISKYPHARNIVLYCA